MKSSIAYFAKNINVVNVTTLSTPIKMPFNVTVNNVPNGITSAALPLLTPNMLTRNPDFILKTGTASNVLVSLSMSSLSLIS